jgi:hypothetical protein
MRRILTMMAGTLLAGGMIAGPAWAMQPPGPGAEDHFGCADGEDSAVAGHPGAAGLVDATALVGGFTDDPLPTAWNAVEHAAPIDFGTC